MHVIFVAEMMGACAVLLFTDPEGFLPAMLAGGEKAAHVCLALLASYCVWLGFFRVLEETGLAKKLSAEECAALYNECIYPELREGELGRVGFSESDAYLAENYDCTIGIEYSSGEYFAVTPGVGAEKTAERLRELGVELHTLKETGYAFPAVN